MDSTHRAKANGHKYREAKSRFVRKAEPWCHICGSSVDKTLEWPDPASPSVDHIIPLAGGGSATDTAGWGLAHLRCNRLKSDTMPGTRITATATARGFLQVDEEGCRDYWHPSREWGDEVLTRCPRGYGYHTLADWVPRAERAAGPTP
jgi:hypothetical protein